MPNVVDSGRQWLAEQLGEHASTPVVYARGALSVALDATVGRSIFEEEDGRGSIVRVETRDYLIKPALLILDGENVLPIEGDTIIETVGDEVEKEFTYQVMPVGAEPCYRFNDSGRFMLRIHTKLIAEGLA